METIANFPDLASAQVASAMLAAEGIDSTIPDENLAGIDWRMTAALHGIRLQVSDEDAERAKELLSESHEPETVEAPIAGEDVCPRCQSDAIRRPRWKRRLKAATMLVPLLLVVWPFVASIRPRAQCSACGMRWSES